MENMDKKDGEMCGGCGHGGCCGGMGHMHGCHGGRHHLLRIILKIFIVIIIFWCGFNLGEMVGSIRAEYGRGYLNGGDVGMMRGYYYSNNMQPANPNAGTTPTPAK
jgi:hypothetical protein